MAEDNNVFRQKSLDRISSPEDLDRYIKTTTPSLWILLIAVIIFLCGILTWSVVGKLETASEVGCKVSGGTIECYIKESDVELIGEESVLVIEEKEIAIDSVSEMKEVDESADSYEMHASGLENGDWYAIVTGKCDLKDGNYKGKAVYETISPIRFIFN